MSKQIIINICVFFFCIYLVAQVDANVREKKDKRAIRLNIPILGIGQHCTGCPARYCDDDPAVILGYCCGCAKLFDKLPVKCAPHPGCPLNTYELCQQYEYMLHCCC